jgi:hypothetical protein
MRCRPRAGRATRRCLAAVFGHLLIGKREYRSPCAPPRQLRDHHDVASRWSTHHGVTTRVSLIHHPADDALVHRCGRWVHRSRPSHCLWHGPDKQTHRQGSCRRRLAGRSRGSRERPSGGRSLSIGGSAMADANEPGGGVVPSARAERGRTWSDDTAGMVIYATVVALVSSFIVAIVVLA